MVAEIYIIMYTFESADKKLDYNQFYKEHVNIYSSIISE